MHRVLLFALATTLVLACEGRGSGVRAATMPARPVRTYIGLPADSLPPAIRELRRKGPAHGTIVEKQVRIEALRDSLVAVGDTTGFLYAATLDLQVETLLSLERLDRTTLELAREVLARKRALGWSGHAEEARSLVNLARAECWAADQFGLADTLFGLAEDILVQHPETPPSDIGLVLRFWAEERITTGDLLAARTMAQRGLELTKSEAWPDTMLLIANSWPLLCAYTGAGLYEDAIEIQNWRIVLQSTFNPRNVRGRSILEAELGMIELAAGSPAKAAGRLQVLLEKVETTGDVDRSDFRGSYASLGSALALMGDLRQARVMLGRALEIRQNENAERSYFGEPWLWLGGVELAEGDPDRARACFERARELVTNRRGPDHPSLPDFLEPLALCIAAQGHADSALVVVQDARRIQAASGTVSESSHLAVAEAGLWLALGQATRADSIYESIAGTAPGSAARQQRAWIQASLALARRDFDSSRPELAVARALAVEERSRAMIVDGARDLPERQALLFASRIPRGLDLAGEFVLSGARLGPELRRTMLDQVIRSRSLVLDAMADRRRRGFERSTGPDAGLWERWSQARRRLHAVRNEPVADRTNAQREAIELELQRELDRAESALIETGKTAADGESAQDMPRLDAVEGSLREGEALVSFLRVRPPVSSSGSARTVPDSGHGGYLAFVLRRGERAPDVIRLGDASLLDRLVQAWHSHDGESGTALREALWDPIVTHLGQARTAILVTDGVIGFVSFAALPLTGGRFLAETGREFRYVACERDLARAPRSDSHPARSLVAVGGVDYERRPATSDTSTVLLASNDGPAAVPAPARYRGAPPSCREFTLRQFEPLPASGAELDEVIALARGSQIQESIVGLTDSHAGEALVCREAQDARFLHLAVHGFTIKPACGFAAAPGLRGLGWSAAEEHLQYENPLTRCGLALAGANRRAEAGPDEDDGLLTGDEIAALDLSGIEFVVLSACNSGVGEVLDGEGVLGLQRAFKIAGAGPVVMSLWPVEDRVARQWMRHFYAARLTAGLTTAEATRRASLAMLAERRRLGFSTPPSSWAPFVSVGVER